MSRAFKALRARQVDRAASLARQSSPVNLVDVVRQRATRLTEAEILRTTEPHRVAAKRLREGVATEKEYSIFLTMVLMALAIEDSGIVKGMRSHLESAKVSLLAIGDRAQAGGTWRPGALYFYELEAIDTALWLHTEQLRHLAWIELHNIVRKFLAQHKTAGGQVEHISLQEVLS